MSIFKAFNKICKPISYEKAIFNLIYGQQWINVVEKDLYNLESHYILKFEELL